MTRHRKPAAVRASAEGRRGAGGFFAAETDHQQDREAVCSLSGVGDGREAIPYAEAAAALHKEVQESRTASAAAFFFLAGEHRLGLSAESIQRRVAQDPQVRGLLVGPDRARDGRRGRVRLSEVPAQEQSVQSPHRRWGIQRMPQVLQFQHKRNHLRRTRCSPRSEDTPAATSPKRSSSSSRCSSESTVS